MVLVKVNLEMLGFGLYSLRPLSDILILISNGLSKKLKSTLSCLCREANTNPQIFYAFLYIPPKHLIVPDQSNNMRLNLIH